MGGGNEDSDSRLSFLFSVQLPPCFRGSAGNRSQVESNSDEFQVQMFWLCSTYSLVHVDGVLAGDNVGDGRASLLAGLDGGGHFCG